MLRNLLQVFRLFEKYTILAKFVKTMQKNLIFKVIIAIDYLIDFGFIKGAPVHRV